jgi:hypothetical protein
MTNTERIELRKWSAELVGHALICSPDCEKYPLPYVRDKTGNEFSWTPDLPTAPASQLLSVIEEMRRRKWNRLDIIHENNRWLSQFSHQWPTPFKFTVADTLPLATLKAGMATGEQ